MTNLAIGIPLRNGDVIEVKINSLPDDFHEITSILQGERVQLSVWLQFAVETSISHV